MGVLYYQWFHHTLRTNKESDLGCEKAERRAQSTERRRQSAERRAQSAERRAQSAERRAQSAENRAHGAERGVKKQSKKLEDHVLENNVSQTSCRIIFRKRVRNGI